MELRVAKVDLPGIPIDAQDVVRMKDGNMSVREATTLLEKYSISGADFRVTDQAGNRRASEELVCADGDTIYYRHQRTRKAESELAWAFLEDYPIHDREVVWVQLEYKRVSEIETYPYLAVVLHPDYSYQMEKDLGPCYRVGDLCLPVVYARKVILGIN